MEHVYRSSIITYGHTFPRGMDPLPGWCFVAMLPDIEANEKGIWIPPSAAIRNRPGHAGTVVVENSITYPRSLASIMGAVGRLCLFPRWAGQRFSWQGKEYTKFRLSLEHFIAVYHDGEWIPLDSEGAEGTIIPDESGVARCPYCRSEGVGNIILDADGVCSVCGRYATGRKAGHVNRMSNGHEVKTVNPVKLGSGELGVMG